MFEKIFSKYANAVTYQGRKLKPISNDPTQNNLTPDLSFEEENGAYKAVNEIKAWLPNEQSYWMKVVDQLRAYDTDFSNWKFPSLQQHDIMITLDPEFTRKFFEYIEKQTSEVPIIRNLAIIESSRKERVLASIFVRMNHGKLAHSKLNKELRNGISNSLYGLVRELTKLKFYDAKPPLIYTMIQMWDHVFSKSVNSREQQNELATGRIISIKLTIEKIHKKLSKLTHRSNSNCIQKSWIKEALDMFVDLGIAESSEPDTGQFIIKYKKHEDNTRTFLLDMIKKKTPQPAKNALDKYIEKEASK